MDKGVLLKLHAQLMLLSEQRGTLGVKDAIETLGHLIDSSDDLHHEQGLERALAWSDELHRLPILGYDRATLHYFQANAWEALRLIRRQGIARHAWDQPEVEKRIIHLRMALGDADHVEPMRRCQVLTNLGSLMSQNGRPVEAIRYWDAAIAIDAAFGMAQANRGLGLTTYSQWVHDPGHKNLLIREAYRSLVKGLAEPLEAGAVSFFDGLRKRIAKAAKPGFLEKGFDYAFPEMSSDELTYRKWCLNQRLFLNDLNDLGPQPIAAADVLTLPSMVVPLTEGPDLLGLFNQMKQEFVSARYLYFEGLSTGDPHFSDREVTLLDTLDYPSYSLATEKIKIAFRVGYSILDKAAFFLNRYFRIGISEQKVSFRMIWRDYGQKPALIRPAIHKPENTPLQGLFWLSQDLYERGAEFSEAVEPDAQAIAEIRNHLEHKYLKLHAAEWHGPSIKDDPAFSFMVDRWAHSLYRADFVQKTHRVLSWAREALIYISLAVYIEEDGRAKKADPNKITPPVWWNKVNDTDKL